MSEVPDSQHLDLDRGFLAFKATVTESGGGKVTLMVDRDTPNYPAEGERIIVGHADNVHLEVIRRYFDQQGRLAQAEDLLRQVEWGFLGSCYFCNFPSEQGHGADCRLSTLLRERT